MLNNLHETNVFIVSKKKMCKFKEFLLDFKSIIKSNSETFIFIKNLDKRQQHERIIGQH